MNHTYGIEWWKERLPLIQAYVEGKTIQELTPSGWKDNTGFAFSMEVGRYRIKPKEWWVNLYMDESRGSVSGSSIHPSEARARQSVDRGLGDLIYLKTIQLD